MSLRSSLCRAAAVSLVALLLAGCGGDEPVPTAAPQVGECRVLTPADVTEPANSTALVDCAHKHTAETYFVGTFADSVATASYGSAQIRAYATKKCQQRFQKYVGADESLGLRTVLSWVWFRPSEEAWQAGARWFRCDVIGGGPLSTSYANLPETTKDLLLGKPADEWMVCARGTSVEDGERVPCSEPHDWRAVTTIKLGRPADAYPGDAAVQAKSSKFCSNSVSAWLQYPVTFDYSFTWFGQEQWDMGNRRSVCWAATQD